MQVQSLEVFGVHRDLLRAGEDSYSKGLLPVQAEAISAQKVLNATSLIVYAPTGVDNDRAQAPGGAAQGRPG